MSSKINTALRKWAVGSLLFLLPFFVYPNGGVDMEIQFNAPKLVGAFLLGNLCFGFYLSQKISGYFGLAHIAVTASVILTGFGAMQMYPFAYWCAAAMLALWVLSVSAEERLFYLKILAVSGVVVAAHAYAQTLGFTWPLQYAAGIDQLHPIAFMGQHTKLGAFLAPISALCLALAGRRGLPQMWYVAATFTTFVVMLTGSSFSILALGAGLLIVLRHKIGRKPVVAIVIMGVIVTASLFYAKPYAEPFLENGRGAVWHETIIGWKAAPYLGHGLGSFRQDFQNQFESKKTGDRYGAFRQAHNDYLQVLYDCGALGGLTLLVVLVGIFLAYRREWWMDACPDTSTCAAQGMLASLLANAIGNFPFQLSPHFLIGVVSAAILLKSARDAATIFAWPLIPYFRSLTSQRK